MATVYPANAVMMPSPMAAALPAPPQWASSPAARAGCPPGLEHLCDNAMTSVIEDVGLEMFAPGALFPNRYSIRNSSGQQMYYGMEYFASGIVNFIGSRNIEVRLTDSNNRVCMTIRRAGHDFCFICCSCTDCQYNAHSVAEVFAADGSLIGRVLHVRGCCEMRLELRDAANNFLMYVICPAFTMTVTLEMHTGDGRRQGWIMKTPSTVGQMMYNAQNYSVQFSAGADVVLKALQLAACLFVDFSFFGDHYNRAHAHYRRYYRSYY